jgi:hypothetical protein
MAANQGLMWPVDDAQRGTVSFDAETGMLEITVSENAEVRAVATGTVSLVAGDWLQITCGQRLVIYESVQYIKVSAGQGVSLGDVIAETGPDARVKLMILDAIDPTSLFAPPASLEDTAEVPQADAEGTIYLTPAVDGLRVRAAPVDGEPVGQIDTQDRVQSLESPEETARKLGVRDEWLYVRLADGGEVYAAAWLLEAAPAPDDTPARPTRIVPAVASLLGMNLDVDHPQGHPDPAEMQGNAWVRIKFNVSYNPDDKSYGNKDIDPRNPDYARAAALLGKNP